MRKITIHIRYAVYLLLGTILLLTGCKSTKKVSTVVSGGAKQETVFFSSLKEQGIQYNTLSARVNMNLDLPGKNLSSRVELKMVKDSVIQLSIVPLLGIEVYRIELTPENILVIDRLNKRYVSENYEQMRSESPIAFNFYNLQALFSNHIFIPGEKEFSPTQYKRFNLIQEGPIAEARIRDNMDLVYAFKADGEEKLLSTQIADPFYTHRVDWDYSDFQLVRNHPFPMLMNVKVTVNQEEKGGIQMGFSRLQINEALKIDSSIPAKYQQVPLDSILKSLTKNL